MSENLVATIGCGCLCHQSPGVMHVSPCCNEPCFELRHVLVAESEGVRCPKCESLSITQDEPYANCGRCGWVGSVEELVGDFPPIDFDSLMDRRPPRMDPIAAESLVHHLGLSEIGMRSDFVHKNLHLVMGTKLFHYSDLNLIDIARIAEFCQENDCVITCWNEHQWTEWEQTPHAIVKITPDGVTYPHREART